MAAPAQIRPAAPAAIGLALTTIYLVWGSTYLAIAVMIDTMPPLLAAGIRYFTAGALVLAGLTIWKRVRHSRGVRFDRRQLGWAVVTAALLPVLGNGGVVLSLERIPTGVAALIIATEPILMALMEAVLDRRPPGRGVVVGAGAGLGGIIVLVAPWQGVGTIDPVGLMLCVGGAVAWSAGSILTPRVGWSVSPPVVGGWQMLLGGGMLLVLGAAAGESTAAEWSSVSTTSIAALAYLILFGSIIAYSAYSWLLGHTRTSVVSTFALVNPMVAVGLGAVVLGERVGPQTAIAGAMILIAVVVILASQARPAPIARRRQAVAVGSRQAEA